MRTQQRKEVMSTKIKSEKAVVKPSIMASEIVSACRVLGYVKKEFGNGSAVVSIADNYVQFLSKLPADKDCSAEARLFRNTIKSLESFVSGDAKKTWVIHKGGSFALYSKFAS